ncbi:MAG: biotin/lipoyl-binding protein, partial [Betaproteobacteria bacterium]
MNPPLPSTPPIPVPRSRTLKRAAFLLAVAALAAYFGRNALLGTPVETVEVLRDDLIQTVVASGRVMSPRRVRVGAVITGRVVAIPVTEGQAVKKGAELVLLEDKDVRSALAQAQA